MNSARRLISIILLSLTLTLSVAPAQAGIISALSKLFREMAESAPDLKKVADEVPAAAQEAPIVKPAPLQSTDDLSPSPNIADDVSTILDDIEDPVRTQVGDEVVVKEPLKLSLDLVRNQDTFATAAREPELLVAMPTTVKQYKTIYKTDTVSAGSEQRVEQFMQQLKRTDGAVDFDGGLTELFTRLDSAEGSPVVVFAHSENGGKKLILPNGNTVLDIEIHKYCAGRGKVCVVLTCHGDDFALPDKIAATDALTMWRSAQKSMRSALANGQAISNEQYIYTMRRQKSQLDTQRKAKVFISFSGPVGAVAYYYASEE